MEIISNQKLKDFRLMRCDLAAKKIENDSNEFIRCVRDTDLNDNIQKNGIFKSFSVFLWSINDAIDTAEAWFVSDNEMKLETSDAVKQALVTGISNMEKIKTSCGNILRNHGEMLKSFDFITKNLDYHLVMINDPDLMKLKNNKVSI